MSEVVWDDDVRLMPDRSCHIGIRSFHEFVVVDLDTREPFGLLVRSGDSVRFLPVKKRRKPLALRVGQRWRRGSTTCLIFREYNNRDGGYLRTLDESDWIPRATPSPLQYPSCEDPRDHGWVLLDDA